MSPRKKQEKRVLVPFRLTPQMRDDFYAMAEDHNRTANEELIDILEEKIAWWSVHQKKEQKKSR